MSDDKSDSSSVDFKESETNSESNVEMSIIPEVSFSGIFEVLNGKISLNDSLILITGSAIVTCLIGNIVIIFFSKKIGKVRPPRTDKKQTTICAYLNECNTSLNNPIEPQEYTKTSIPENENQP